MQTYSKSETTLERMLDKLPFHLQKGEHIKGYYRVFACLYDELMDQFATILNYLDVEQAQGYALDLIGDTMNCKRIPLYISDENYRTKLKIQIAKNNSEGKIEDINSIANALLGKKFIGIKQGYEIEGEKEPSMLKIDISADELKKEFVQYNKTTLKTGTINTGTHNLGSGIEGIADKKVKKEFKSLEIPDLKQAVATGVRLEYYVKNKPDIINTFMQNTTKFLGKTQKIVVNKEPQSEIFNLNECIDIKTAHTIYDIINLKCGTSATGAKMGVLF